ncbi:MAG: hypothetical protein RLZZ621_1002 [Gemmatimonadota bacterium]
MRCTQRGGSSTRATSGAPARGVPAGDVLADSADALPPNGNSALSTKAARAPIRTWPEFPAMLQGLRMDAESGAASNVRRNTVSPRTTASAPMANAITRSAWLEESARKEAVNVRRANTGSITRTV